MQLLINLIIVLLQQIIMSRKTSTLFVVVFTDVEIYLVILAIQLYLRSMYWVDKWSPKWARQYEWKEKDDLRNNVQLVSMDENVTLWSSKKPG